MLDWAQNTKRVTKSVPVHDRSMADSLLVLQLLQKRASASKKASRRRQELMKAKEFEMQQQLQQEKVSQEKVMVHCR